MKCPSCQEEKLYLIEPGFRYHRRIKWEGETLVVDQTYPIEFIDSGRGEMLICDDCGYDKFPKQIEWK